jgi:hypothetical protein
VQNTLFPRVLVHFVALRLQVGQNFPRTVDKGVLLQFVPKVQQVRPVNLQLPAQPSGALSFGYAPQYQHYLAAGVLGALKDCARENIEKTATIPTTVLQHRRTARMVLAIVAAFAARAVQMPIVEHLQQPSVAAVFVQKFTQRKVHVFWVHFKLSHQAAFA